MPKMTLCRPRHTVLRLGPIKHGATRKTRFGVFQARVIA